MAATPTSTHHPEAVYRYDNMAWIFVLGPALLYFVFTRLHQLGASLAVVADQVFLPQPTTSCPRLQNLFYLSSCGSEASIAMGEEGEIDGKDSVGVLRYSLDLVLGGSARLEHVNAMAWKHDTETLGRGFLLLSDRNQVWRYEVGGGPIAIGKSLHLDQAGCRSPTCSAKQKTSTSPSTALQGDYTGGLAVQFQSSKSSGNANHPMEGPLLVAEWGEGRIIRMEDNGARTPLVLQLNGTRVCDENVPSAERVRATNMLVSPFGDLWFLHEETHCGSASRRRRRNKHRSLWRLPALLRTPTPLESLQKSREAHAWQSLPNTTAAEDHAHWVLPAGEYGGLALSSDWTKLYLTSRLPEDGSVVLLEVPLQIDEEDDEDEDASGLDREERLPWQKMEPKVVMNLTDHAVWADEDPGLIATTQLGNILFWSTPKGVLVVDLHNTANDKKASTTLPAIHTLLPTPTPPTALTLGDDGFLYVATANTLLRIRTRTKPVQMPTNLA